MTASGIRRNLPQFSLLVVINGLVGALVGQERTLLPLVAEGRFGLTSALATSAFLISFGLSKAPSNLLAGFLADRIGRRRVMQIGWVVGMPVPFILMIADSWSWVLVANVLLGVNQGLTWSTTVLMKVDLAGPDERGRAIGWNEAAGYTAVGVSAFASGLLADRFGVGFQPFVLGAVVVFLGGLLTLRLRETWDPASAPNVTTRARLREVARDPLLRACSRIGLINNANDAFVWALLPLLLLDAGRTTAEIALVAATYPVMWGLLQLLTGPLSDRLGRRTPVAAGMSLQTISLLAFALGGSLWSNIGAAAALGLGTALAYPALIAAAVDSASPHARASSVGFFRMWRDAGYALGAIGFGAAADAWGLSAATVVVAVVTGMAALDAVAHLQSHADSR